MIAIIDYGLGNSGSIVNMLKVIGEKSIITHDRNTIKRADKLILPGMGSFDSGCKNLDENNLRDIIISEVLDYHKPLMGICLGMQLLGLESEEGSRKGLGLINFKNRKFSFPQNSTLKIPHIGWDVVKFQKNLPILDGIHNNQRYYFAHSYHAVCEDYTNVLMTCEYGYEFPAAVIKDNIIGVQFHPEKSHKFGMALLNNFVHNIHKGD